MTHHFLGVHPHQYSGYAYRYQGQFTLRGATPASAATHTTPKWSSTNLTQACDLNVHHACGSYILAT